MDPIVSNLIADVEIKKLNNFIKTNNCTPYEAKAIKYTRRLKKMSQYNKAQRDKKKQHERALEAEKEQLKREYDTICHEVIVLKEAKLHFELIQLLDNLHDKYDA